MICLEVLEEAGKKSKSSNREVVEFESIDQTEPKLRLLPVSSVDFSIEEDMNLLSVSGVFWAQSMLNCRKNVAIVGKWKICVAIICSKDLPRVLSSDI